MADAYAQHAEQAGREDEVCFLTVIVREQEIPCGSDADEIIRKMYRERLAFAVTRLKPETRQMIAEDMDEILNSLKL